MANQVKTGTQKNVAERWWRKDAFDPIGPETPEGYDSALSCYFCDAVADHDAASAAAPGLPEGWEETGVEENQDYPDGVITTVQICPACVKDAGTV